VKKHVIVGAAVAAAVSVLLTLPVGAQGRQGRAGGSSPQTAAQNVSQRAATIKRLPDGTPDIREAGTWDGYHRRRDSLLSLRPGL